MAIPRRISRRNAPNSRSGGETEYEAERKWLCGGARSPHAFKDILESDFIWPQGKERSKMKRRWLSILLSVCMVITLLPPMAVTAGAADGVWKGGGTSDTPYLIEDVADLQKLAANVNSGTSYSGKYFKLTSNLDLSSITNWTPIGNSSYAFQGTFDGDFHTIYNLTINTGSRYCGLFGRVNNATIKNLGVENANVVSTSNDAAVLVGNAEEGGTISRCYVIGSVSASGGNGGILASTHGSSNATTIENCYARITLINTGSTADISGISGWNYSDSVIIQNCFSACVGETRPVAGWSDGSPVNVEKITNTFYDNTLSPNLSDGLTSLGRSSSLLQLENTFTGWDFDTVWAVDSTKNGGYPYLKGFTPGLGGAPGSVSVTVKDSEGAPVTDAAVVIKNAGDTGDGTTLSHESNGVYSGTVTTTDKAYDIYVDDTKVGIVTQTGSAAATKTVTAPAGGEGGDPTPSPECTIYWNVSEKENATVDTIKAILGSNTEVTLPGDDTAGVIILNDSVTLTTPLCFAGGKWVLDLKGNTLTFNDEISGGSIIVGAESANDVSSNNYTPIATNLTIKDSSSGGKVTGGTAGVNNLSTLTVEGGTLEGSYSGIMNRNGTLKLEGGIFTATGNGGVAIYNVAEDGEPGNLIPLLSSEDYFYTNGTSDDAITAEDTLKSAATLQVKRAGSVPPSGEAVLLNDGYPYGKAMGSSQITLVMDAENATGYQWQVADTKDGTYENIADANVAGYTFTPDSGKWYRCLVNGTVESKAVQVVKPDSDDRTWTKPYDYGSNYYVTNGTIAYMVNNTIFDVAGLYVKDATSYMLSTSYNRYWQTYSSTVGEPDAGSSGHASLDALRVAFSEGDACAVLFEADLAEGQQAFSFGCDTQLGNSSTSGSYSDRAALIAKITNGSLDQVSMMGAASETSVEANTPAFVIAPDNTTPASKFWVGYYGSRKTYTYNTKTSADDTTTELDGQNVVTRVENTDSGMTMSWLNVAAGGSVKFKFAVGSVMDTGAVDASEIIGTVTDSGQTPQPLSGVTVKLMKGNTQIGQTRTTDASGEFSFSNVWPGTYNLVAEKDGVTKTVKIIVEEADLRQDIQMPNGKTSSVVEVKNDTPAVVVGNLEAAFDTPGENTAYTPADAATIESGGSVEFKMTVERKDDTAITEDVAKIAAVKTVDETIGFYLDMSLKKTVTPSGGSATVSPVTEMNVLLENIVPLSEALQGKADYTVYRVHNGIAEALPSSDGSGEGFKVSSGKTEITIYAKKFSTYAIGYTEEGTEPTPPTPPVGGDNGPTVYTITGADTENGAMTISRKTASKGTTVTITVTPDEGYVLSGLTVTDKSGKEIAVTEKNGKYTFTMPASNVTVSACFVKAGCPKDETCPVSAFADADAGAWYHDGAHYCLEHDLMKGLGDGRFAPEDDTSRVMIVMMLWRLNGSSVVNYALDFEDVDEDAWYTEAVRWAVSEGIAGGYGNGKFGPDDTVTREQMVTILWRYAQYKGCDVSVSEDTDILSYGDVAEVAEYAIPAMQWACSSGMVEGKQDGNGLRLDPRGSTTRAQTATMMMRFCTQIGK